jgi:hypothetical protein
MRQRVRAKRDSLTEEPLELHWTAFGFEHTDGEFARLETAITQLRQ